MVVALLEHCELFVLRLWPIGLDGKVQVLLELPRRFVKKVFFRCLVIDANIMGKVPVGAAKVFDLTALLNCSSASIANEEAPVHVDILLRQVVVVTHLLPHTGSRFAKYILAGGCIDGDGNVELGQNSIELLLPGGQTFRDFGRFIFRVGSQVDAGLV